MSWVRAAVSRVSRRRPGVRARRPAMRGRLPPVSWTSRHAPEIRDRLTAGGSVHAASRCECVVSGP